VVLGIQILEPLSWLRSSAHATSVSTPSWLLEATVSWLLVATVSWLLWHAASLWLWLLLLLWLGFWGSVFWVELTSKIAGVFEDTLRGLQSLVD